MPKMKKNGTRKLTPPVVLAPKKKNRLRSKKTKAEQCLNCGVDLYIQKSRQGRKFFCSEACHSESMRNGAQIACSVCGKSFWLRQSNIDCGVTTCSYECGIDKRAQKIKVVSLDTLWAKAIKLRAGYKCEYCGSGSRPNAHHIYSRAFWSTRWDLDNGICLCVKHHLLTALSAHKAPLFFADWIREDRGPVWNERLLRRVKAEEKPDKYFLYYDLIYWVDCFEDPNNNEWNWEADYTLRD